MPDLSYEKQQANYKYIIGVDEVGRGPWAGPVVACASIILDETKIPTTVADSKKLSDKKRQEISKVLIKEIPYSLGIVQADEIDKINILQATFVAMAKSVESLVVSLNLKPDEYFVLVDGNKIPPFACFKNSQAIIKGDDKSLTIAASSIIAKVFRDNLMADLAQQYPFYAWEKNAGYGTKAHQEGLALNGITPLHRKSFKPIAKIIKNI